MWPSLRCCAPGRGHGRFERDADDHQVVERVLAGAAQAAVAGEHRVARPLAPPTCARALHPRYQPHVGQLPERSRSTLRLTPICVANSRSGGSASPGAYEPLRIASSSCATTRATPDMVCRTSEFQAAEDYAAPQPDAF